MTSVITVPCVVGGAVHAGPAERAGAGHVLADRAAVTAGGDHVRHAQRVVRRGRLVFVEHDHDDAAGRVDVGVP